MTVSLFNSLHHREPNLLFIFIFSVFLELCEPQVPEARVCIGKLLVANGFFRTY